MNFQTMTPLAARKHLEGKRLRFGDAEQIKLIALLEDAKKLSDMDPMVVDVNLMEWHEIRELL